MNDDSDVASNKLLCFTTHSNTLLTLSFAPGGHIAVMLIGVWEGLVEYILMGG